MHALSLVGFKKSGKTNAAVELLEVLKGRGLTVGAAKFSAHGFDREGTDTARFLAAGARVAGISESETAFFWPESRYLPDLLPLMACRALVVEGGKALDWLPRVLLLREPAEAEELSRGLALATYGGVRAPGLPHLETPEALADLLLERGFALPGLDCGACGRENCLEMAREIVAGQAAPSDCKAAAGEVEVTVNGSRLAMNPFIENVIAGTVRGMLGSLKGYAPGGDISLSIKK
jgi:molybdopterin-guanine dinucleotide biosynthesis protein B